MKKPIELKEALERNGRINEVCIHCGKPLFYNIDGILVKDKTDKLQLSQYQIMPPHLKWLLEGRKIGNNIYFRTVCWECLRESIREAYKKEDWCYPRLKGWIKDVIDGKPAFPNGKASALGKNLLPLVFTNISDEDKNEASKLYDTASIESFIKRYGEEEGKAKYESYVSFHSAKNTYEWKHEHCGWNKEKFDEYNKSRAATKENMIKRYGEKEGAKRFDAYCKIQAYAGCSLDYFKELYGEDGGTRFYNELNKKKAHTIESYIERLGEEGGIKKWQEWYSNTVNRLNTSKQYSDVSQELFNDILQAIDEDKQMCRFATYNGELKVECENGKTIIADFAFGNKIIEFNGDYWHRNPELYTGDLITEDVKEIWKRDSDRLNALAELGYEVFVVWELDYHRDPDMVLMKCIDFIEGNSL